MKGLIIKDLLFIKSNLKLFAIVIMFSAVSFVMNTGGNFISFLVPFSLTMLCISSFGYDEYNKWDAYSITFPVRRKDIVKSKYLFTVFISLLGGILSLLLTLILELVNGKMPLTGGLETLAGGLTAVLLLVSFIYPAIYKFGSEKGRIIIFVIGFGISGLGALIISQIKKMNISISSSLLNILNDYGIYIGILVVILILFLSYLLSSRIYNKKKF